MTVCSEEILKGNKKQKNGQSRETGNIGQIRQRKTKQKHNTIWIILYLNRKVIGTCKMGYSVP